MTTCGKSINALMHDITEARKWKKISLTGGVGCFKQNSLFKLQF